MQHVFCILGILQDIFFILYLSTKILVFKYLKYIQQTQIQFRLISFLSPASQQLTAAAAENIYVTLLSFVTAI